MLDDKYHIEEYADVSEHQLDRISGDPRPVALQIRINTQLRNRQCATRKIEQDLCYGPSMCGVVSIIRKDLRHIFDESNNELDVRYGIDLRAKQTLA